MRLEGGNQFGESLIHASGSGDKEGHKERDLGGKIVGILCLIRYGIKD